MRSAPMAAARLLQCNRRHSIRDPCTLSQSRPTDGCGDGGRQQRRAECPARPCKVRPDGLRSATASRSQVKSRPCAGQPAARAPAGMFRPGRRGRGGGGARVVPRAVLGPRRAAPAYPGATDPAGGRAGTGVGLRGARVVLRSGRRAAAGGDDAASIAKGWATRCAGCCQDAQWPRIERNRLCSQSRSRRPAPEPSPFRPHGPVPRPAGRTTAW